MSAVCGSVECSRDEAAEKLNLRQRNVLNKTLIPLNNNVTIQDSAVRVMLKLQLILSTPNINISLPYLSCGTYNNCFYCGYIKHGIGCGIATCTGRYFVQLKCCH